jgi:3-oxoadipate enol-lactonase
MKIKANGIDFNTLLEGPESAPCVIFSNSLATDLTMWDDQAAALKDRFRVLRYDQRGHGKTEAPAGRYSFDLLMADIVALMDALSIKRAHWCGISMGGATGMGLAQKYPDRFDRFAICDTPGMSTPATAQQWEERIATAQKDGMAALVESTLARWFPKETLEKNPPNVQKIRAMIASTPVNGFVGCSAALADHNYRPGMANVKHKVLYMTGEKDGTNAAAMRQMQQELPGSQYVELPGAGHISNTDQPAMFTKALRELFAG